MERFLVKHLPALGAHCRAMALVGMDPLDPGAAPELQRWPACVKGDGAQDAVAEWVEDLPQVVDELLTDMGSASQEQLVHGLQEVARAVVALGGLEPVVEVKPSPSDDSDHEPDVAPKVKPKPTGAAQDSGWDFLAVVPTPVAESTAFHLRGHAMGPTAGALAVEGVANGWRTRAVMLWGEHDEGLEPMLESARGWMSRGERRHYLFLLQRESGDGDRLFALSLGLEAARQNTNVPGLVRWRLREGEALADTLPPPAFLPESPSCVGQEEVVDELVLATVNEDPPPIPVRGAPGIGKSTVCLAALHDERVVERFQQRRFYVRCDAVRTGDGILHEIARAVGLDPGLELEQRLLRELAREPALLVLDGVTIPWELDTVSTEEVLTTLSRIYDAALVVSLDETGRPVGPLWRRSILVPRLDNAAARVLFMTRSSPRYANDPHLADLLVAQEGIPMAIELLAQTVGDEADLSEVWNRWRDARAEVLGRHGEPGHLASLTVTLQQVLASPRMTAPVRRLLSLIAVFRRGIARRNLESLLPGVAQEAARTLVELGLAFFDEDAHLRTLPTIRRYAQTHLPPSPDDLRQAAAHYLVGFIRGRENNFPLTYSRPAEDGEELAEEGPEPEDAPLPGEAPDPDPEVGPKEQSPAEADEDLGQALARLEQALRSHRERQEPGGASLVEAHCLRSLGDLAAHAGEAAVARERFEQALEMYEELDSAQGEADCQAALGDLTAADDLAAARERYQLAMDLYTGIHDLCAVGMTYRRLARICEAPEVRRAMARQAHEQWRRLGRTDLMAELTAEFGSVDDGTPTAESAAVSTTALTLSDAAAVDVDGTHRVGEGDPVVLYPRRNTDDLHIDPDGDTMPDHDDLAPSAPEPGLQPDPTADKVDTVLVNRVKPDDQEQEQALDEFASGVTPLPALVEEDGAFDTGQFRAIRDSAGLPSEPGRGELTLIRLADTPVPPSPKVEAPAETPTVQDASAVLLPAEFVATGHPFRVGPNKVILNEHEPNDRLYLLVEGEAELYKEPRDRSGKPKVVSIGKLTEGAVFGEAALLGNEESLFSVRTTTPCRLRIFSGAAVAELLDDEDSMSAQLLRKVFSDRLVEAAVALSPILRPMHPRRCRTFLGRFTPVTLAAGATVVSEGDTDSGLYLILLGEVEATCEAEGEDAVRLHLMSEGDFLGEIPLLLEAPSPATFTARPDAQLLHLPAEAYHQHASDEPALRTLMEIEARRRQQKYEAVKQGNETYEVGTTVRKLAGKRKEKESGSEE